MMKSSLTSLRLSILKTMSVLSIGSWNRQEPTMESNADANQNSTTTTGQKPQTQQTTSLLSLMMSTSLYLLFVDRVTKGLGDDGCINWEVRTKSNTLLLHYRNKVNGRKLLFERIYAMSTFSTPQKCIDLCDVYFRELNNYIDTTLAAS